MSSDLFYLRAFYIVDMKALMRMWSTVDDYFCFLSRPSLPNCSQVLLPHSADLGAHFNWTVYAVPVLFRPPIEPAEKRKGKKALNERTVKAA